MPRNGNAWLYWWSTLFIFKWDGYPVLQKRIATLIIPCHSQWQEIYLKPPDNDND